MEVPVIDLTDFVDGAADRRAEVGRRIDSACRTVGFFSVVGHGVDNGVVERAHDAASAFFDLPLADRMGAATPEPQAPYGYVPFSARANSGRELTPTTAR